MALPLLLGLGALGLGAGVQWGADWFRDRRERDIAQSVRDSLDPLREEFLTRAALEAQQVQGGLPDYGADWSPPMQLPPEAAPVSPLLQQLLGQDQLPAIEAQPLAAEAGPTQFGAQGDALAAEYDALIERGMTPEEAAQYIAEAERVTERQTFDVVGGEQDSAPASQAQAAQVPNFYNPPQAPLMQGAQAPGRAPLITPDQLLPNTPAGNAERWLAFELAGTPYMRQTGNQLLGQLIDRQVAEANTRARLQATMGADQQELAVNQANLDRAFTENQRQFGVVQDRLERQYQTSAQQWGEDFAFDRTRLSESAAQARELHERQIRMLDYEWQNRNPLVTKTKVGGGDAYHVRDPLGGPGHYVFPEGHPEHTKRLESLDSMAQMHMNIDALMKESEQFQNFGVSSRARIGQRYGEIVSGIARMRNLGVLQPGELEMLQDALPNLADLTSNDIKGRAALSELKNILNEHTTRLVPRYARSGVWSMEFDPEGNYVGRISAPGARSRSRETFSDEDIESSTVPGLPGATEQPQGTPIELPPGA